MAPEGSGAVGRHAIAVFDQMISTQKPHKKIQPILILVMLITMGILVMVFLSTRRSKEPLVTEPPVADREATLSIAGVQMTSTRDGRIVWNLTAQTGNYLDQYQKAKFHQISTIFYTQRGQQVFLTADDGCYHSESNDLEVSGNVVVKNTQYQMKTQHLTYEDQPQSLKSKQRVTVWNKTMRMTAGSMQYNLRTEKITLKGNVSGIICDNIAL